MLAFIVFFFPAVISLWILEKVSHTTLSRREWIYRFALHTLLINFVYCAIKTRFLHTGDNVIFSFAADMAPSVACNYLTLALPLAIALPLIPKVLRFFSPYVRFHIESTDGDDK